MSKFTKVMFLVVIVWFFSGTASSRVATAYQSTATIDCKNIDIKNGPLSPVGPSLAALYCGDDASFVLSLDGADRRIPLGNNDLLLMSSGPTGDLVVVDAIAAGDVETLQADLEALGVQDVAAYGAVVSGRLPVSAIDDMAALGSLNFARAAMATTNVGLTTSQGDAAMKTDDVRTALGIDGSGVTVGTLSDSYDCLGGAAGDVGTGDLPAGVTVLLDEPGCGSGSDEGRAMMQLIMDVAPGASQAFNTAFTGEAGFAAGITALSAISDVIVDDVGYFAEPMFQDGIIAQAVDVAVATGDAYFSSAGNANRDGYEAPYVASGSFIDIGFGPEEAHDFDPGGGTDIYQSVTIPVGGTLIVSFQWDEPYASATGGAGSTNDMDIILLDDPVTTVVTGAATANVGGDPVEVFGYTNPGPATAFNLAFLHASGTAPGIVKYVLFSFPGTVNEYFPGDSTVFGHSNAAGAETVGAAPYFSTPDFGVSPPLLESFSSAGPTPILFDLTDTPVSITRMKPEIVAPDGTNTTFFGVDIEPDGFPNFFGTSAAAPHAAAMAALLLECDPTVTPATTYALMEATAVDMLTAGFDDDSGYGLIEAEFICADFSDLASSYGVAWHAGSGSLKLGSAWTSDSTFALAQDDPNDDGVVRSASAWTPGTTSGSVDVTVAGCGAPPCYLNAWVDWNADGDFTDTDEQILTDIAVSTGGPTTLSGFTIPAVVACYGGGGPCNARFRLTSASGTTEIGLAADGEVSDYAWGFTPTALTLNSFSVNSIGGTLTPAVWLAVVSIVGVVGLGVIALRRRRQR